MSVDFAQSEMTERKPTRETPPDTQPREAAPRADRASADVPSDAQQYLQYRALSSAAVVSLVLGLFSFLAWLDWFWAVVPAIGILVALFAIRQLRQRGDELTGLSLAHTGLLLSTLFLLTGLTRLSYVYATELPDGYARISYDQLQPDADIPSQVVPPSALELDGKRVFIKGYPLSGRDREGIKHFVLVRDQGDCCFGGTPKLTDQIQVTLADPLRLTYELRLLRVAGTFRVRSAVTPGGMATTVYQLEADHLQ